MLKFVVSTFFSQGGLQRRGFGFDQSGHQRRQIYLTARLVELGNDIIAEVRHLHVLFTCINYGKVARLFSLHREAVNFTPKN